MKRLKLKLEHTKFKFAPFSPKQHKVLTWWCPSSPVKDRRGIIADGSIRSGKTLSLSLSFVLWAMANFNGCNFAMCGKTIGSFRRNVLDLLKRMLKSIGLYRYEEYRADNLLLVSFGGNTNRFFIFGGKDEGSQDLIQGFTLAGVLFDEVALMPESFVAQAMARCSVEGAKYWFDCNPDHPGHWFYKEWIQKRMEKRLLYLHFNMHDNRTLSADKIAEYESMYSGVFYDRFVLGKWTKAQGLVYPMFNAAFHVVPDVPRPYEQYYLSCDYGTLNPFSMGLWGLADGKWYRIQEYYWDGRTKGTLKTDEEYYSELESLANDLEIEDVIVDPSAASFIECIRRHDKYSVRKADNDVVSGIRQVSSYLKRGCLFLNDCCEDSIREFNLYVWDEKSIEKDRPVKENDHAMDDIRYFVNTAMSREE